VRRLGVDVSRFPDEDQEYRAFRALMSSNPRTLIDVGANRGQFALTSRRFGFDGLIVSLEPGTAAYADLRSVSARDPLWEVHQLAAGASTGTATLHVAGNQGASSSLLPMLDRHMDAAPNSRYVRSETVPIVRLDDPALRSTTKWIKPALKIDAQGFEQQVLAGCGDWLNSVVAIRIELSLVPLYDRSWLWRDAASWLESRGFNLAGIAEGFSDPRSGRLLQIDGVFLRDTDA